MRLDYDVRTEHKNNHWLGISGSVLIVATIIGCLFQVMN